jgi:DNA-nicking Smr family endonuclease
LTNKLSDKDKKDWQKFLDSSEKLQSKDVDQVNNQIISERSIDLHGYTLEEANKKISKFIENCYVNKVKKINVITGKGMRSKNLDDPYQSTDLSILKYSVPEFVKNNSELMKKIIRIDFESVNSPSKGNFDIFLKTIK